MSIIKSIKQVLGLGPAAENHHWDGSVPNQLSLRRGTPEAPGTEVLKVVDGVLEPVQTGPAFSATPAVQAGTANFTFVSYTELFDTDSRFDPSNGRFTPNVGGYYDMKGMLQTSTTLAFRIFFLKNGVETIYGPQPSTSSANSISALIYMNGTTDFLQMGIATNASYTTETGADRSLFQGFLARKA